MDSSAVASASPATPTSSYDFLARIAAELASAGGRDDVLQHIVDGIRDAVSAASVSIWIGRDDEPLVCTSRSGAESPTFVELSAALHAVPRGGSHGRLSVVRLVAAGGEEGALVMVREQPLSPSDWTFVRTSADILAPALRHAADVQRLERELLERSREAEVERRFTQRIIDSLPVGLYVIDRDYRISVWNSKRETGMQGVSRDDAIGRTIFDILHRQPEAVLRREFDDVFATGRLQTFQMESTATGELRTYRLSKIPMRIGDGVITHVITIGEDVTEWRAAHDRFAQAEKLAAIGTLAAGVMHEINNPLATIAACAESLQLMHEDAAPAIVEGLRLIQSEVHRCKGITDALLDFSRPKGGDKTRVDVNDAIDRTLFVLKHHARFKRLVVQTELDRTLGAAVWANEEQLVQLFMALLINAMDAMHDSGTVALRTRAGEDGTSFVAEVVDQGEGIRRADLPKIFEPFFTTKQPGRGTGLGLSICYAIVEEHGGTIEVESTPGQGSVFRIVLPMTTIRGEQS